LKYQTIHKICCVIALIFLSQANYAQSKRINILHSDRTYKDEKQYPNAIVLSGKVKIEHEGAILSCSKALLYQNSNEFHAFGNVVITQGDTIEQTSTYAKYNANQKIFTSWGKVRMKSPSMLLTTDTLYFDRIDQKVFYNSNGTITNTDSKLTSKNGTFYLNINKFTGTQNVVATTKNNRVESTHLDYYTNSKNVYMYGPSTIYDSKATIYTEKGSYNQNQKIAKLTKNSWIKFNDLLITGDSIFHDQNREFADATGNVSITDTINNSLLQSEYVAYFKSKDSIFAVNRPVVINVYENDSMFIHGDTIVMVGIPGQRIVRIYHHVKIFKSDFRGKCDSLHTDERTGITEMIHEPILWSGENQITGDSIYLLSNTKTQQLDSLKILNNAFMVGKDSAGYNQIRGIDMLGKFKNNKLHSLLVKGNGEMIHYDRDSEDKLFGITKTASSNILFGFENSNIKTMQLLNDATGTTYPPSKFPDPEKRLKGFIWRGDEMPLVKEDIFVHD